jgi:hypothetical protein
LTKEEIIDNQAKLLAATFPDFNFDEPSMKLIA